MKRKGGKGAGFASDLAVGDGVQVQQAGGDRWYAADVVRVVGAGKSARVLLQLDSGFSFWADSSTPLRAADPEAAPQQPPPVVTAPQPQPAPPDPPPTVAPD